MNEVYFLWDVGPWVWMCTVRLRCVCDMYGVLYMGFCMCVWWVLCLPLQRVCQPVRRSRWTQRTWPRMRWRHRAVDLFGENSPRLEPHLQFRTIEHNLRYHRNYHILYRNTTPEWTIVCFIFLYLSSIYPVWTTAGVKQALINTFVWLTTHVAHRICGFVQHLWISCSQQAKLTSIINVLIFPVKKFQSQSSGQ